MDSATIRSPRDLVRRGHRPLLALTGAMVVLAVVCVVGLLVDPRTLGGASIWAKPFKFSVSIALYGATLAWMISLVSRPGVHRWASRAGTVAAVTAGIEMVAIVGQVVRDRPSHFNVSTPFDAAVWSVMAVSIAALWVATGVIGVLLLREKTLAPATAWAVRLGIGVALIGMATAFLMTGPTGAQIAAAPTAGMPTVGAHTVGPPDGGPGLPLVGWSTVGGDLRIGHFVGLHALQGLPLIALGLLVLARRVPALRPESVRARLVLVAALGWTGLTLLLTWQALRAQPLLAPDATTGVVAGVLVLAVVAGAVAAVRTGRSARVGAGAP